MILTELTIKNNEILYLTSYQSSYFIEAEELHPKRRSCFLLFQTLKVTLTQTLKENPVKKSWPSLEKKNTEQEKVESINLPE